MRFQTACYREGETAMSIAPECEAERHQVRALKAELEKSGARLIKGCIDWDDNSGGVTVFLKWTDEEKTAAEDK